MPILPRFALCLSCLALVLGCAKSEPVEVVPSEEVRLYFPSETSPIVASEIARFNSLGLKSTKGTTVSVVPFQSDGPSPSSRILADPSDLRAAVWLAPSSLAVDLLTQGASSELTSPPECTSVATTDLGFAVRQNDLFAIDQYDGSGILAQFANSAASNDPAKRPILAAPAPGSSASGLALFAMQASSALGVRPESLLLSHLQAREDSLRATQEGTSRYFRSEQEMLRWLRERPDGQPAAALTSRQQTIAANASRTGAELTFVRSAAPQFTLDYPICLLINRGLSANARAAQAIVFQHFSRPQIGTALRTIGFTARDDAPASDRRFAAGLGSTLAQLWPKVRKPAAIAFVIDTSSETDANFLPSISRELSSFSRWNSVNGNALTLITISTQPEVLADLTSDLRQFQHALQNLHPSGTAVPLDGISLAFGSLESLSPSRFRTGVVLVASQSDTGSAASLAALRARFAQSLARSGTALYVVGVESAPQGEQKPQNFDALKRIAADLSADYTQTTIGELPQSLRTALQQVE